MTNLHSLSLSQLAAMYNVGAELLKKKTVNRFSDTEVGVRRVKEIIAQCEAAGIDINSEAPEAPAAKPASAQKKTETPKVAKTNGAERKTRSAIANDQKLYPVYNPNPRRFKSFGWKSYEIILKSPGITRVEFIKAGGRAKDLAWDVEHEAVSFEKVTQKAKA